MDTMKILTINLWHDMEGWTHRLPVLMEQVQALQPDFVALQEVLEHGQLPNQAQTLAMALGFDWFFDSVDPVGHHKRYGNAILSRHRIVRVDARGLEPFDDCRVAVHVGAQVNERLVDLYTTHLHHLPQGRALRLSQIEQLFDFIAETRATGQVVVTGDLNADPHWPEIARITQRFDDTFALVGVDSGRPSNTTMNLAHGGAPRRIDYIFVERSDKPQLRPLRSRIVLDERGANGAWASDHFGVLTEFKWLD